MFPNSFTAPPTQTKSDCEETQSHEQKQETGGTSDESSNQINEEGKSSNRR